MKKDQLFDLLTELDDKYYEEAIGGDPQKPLRIDVSRKPVKWYRIAAPIAACLVIAAGIIAAPRILDHIRAAESDPDTVISDSNVSVSDPAVSVSEPIILPELTDYYGHYPMIDIGSVPIFNSVEEATGTNTANLTLSVTKYGEYDVCLTGDGVFHILGENDDLLCMKGLSLSLVKNGDRYSHTETAKNKGMITEFYSYTIHTEHIPTIKVYEFSNCAVAVYKKFFSIKGDEIAMLSGKSVDSVNIGYNYSVRSSLEQTGNSLIDKDSKREYRFNFNTFGDTSGSAENFTELFYDVEGEPLTVQDYPMFKPSNLPAFDSEPSAEEKSDTMVRGMINQYTIEEDDSKEYGDLTKVALVAKNLYRINGEDDLTIHGEDLTFILYKNNEIIKELKLAPSYDRTSITVAYSLTDKHYVFKGYTIFIINSDCFAALTDEGELVLLKGLMPDGTLGCSITPIEELQKFKQTENSLIDMTNNIEYRFSPDNFKYADPTAQQAHFSVIGDLSEPAAQLWNGHVYSRDEENIPLPDLSDHKAILGTQQDLDRWNEFIKATDPPILTFIAKTRTNQLDDKYLDEILDIIREMELEPLKEFPASVSNGDPDNSGQSAESGSDNAARRATEIFAFNDDGELLFSLYYDNYEYAQVIFGGSQISYLFNAKGSGIDDLRIYF